MNTFIRDLIENRFEEFLNICKQHHVDKLFLFGSGTSSRFNPEKSDVDLLVALNIEDPLEYGESLMSLWDAFELFFARKVDLLTDESIKNEFLKADIEVNKQLIYDGKREKVLV